MKEESLVKISKTETGLVSECSFEMNPFLMLEIVKILSQTKDSIMKKLEGIIMKKLKDIPKGNIPEDIKEIINNRKTSNDIISLFDKIRDMNEQEKKQVIKDISGLVNKGV